MRAFTRHRFAKAVDRRITLVAISKNCRKLPRCSLRRRFPLRGWEGKEPTHTVLPLESVPALCCRIAHPSDPYQVRMQTSPRSYDYSRADVLVAQDKARSTRFGPPEYTLLPLRPSGLRPSALLERLALLTSAHRCDSHCNFEAM